MDVNAIKNVIDKQIEVAKATKLLNQSKPEPRPSRNPAVEAMQWEMKNLQSDVQKNNGAMVKVTILSGDIHTSKTPFEELKSIKLCDMKVPMIHHGRYLVCKVIGKPAAIVGVNTLIQDLNGDVEKLAIYNFRYNMADTDWIPTETILVIKEPWLRYGALSADKNPSIRVDSPTDVIVVDSADEEFMNKIGAMQWYEQVSKDAEVWRVKGNECFNDRKYEKALFFYDRGIRCNPELGVLYLNKAMACLKTGAYYDAYESAKIGLEKSDDKETGKKCREKALYRMGQAASGMRQWKQAADRFLDVLKNFPENVDAPKEFKRATARLAEEKTGLFDFKAMLLESKKDKPNVEVADYVGPTEVTEIPGKGRGIIASKDIKEGTLLCVSKAFSSGYDRDFSGTLLSINLIRNDSDPANIFLQVIDTMKQLKNNPHRAKEVYDLFAGDDVSNEEIKDNVVDAARIQQISSYNRFAAKDLDQNVESMKARQFSGTSDNSHIFLFPSYFNHACYANAVRTFYADVMVIRAAANIKKGDEISLSYISPLMGYSERKKRLSGWKFTCHCKLCEMDANDPLCLKRNEIYDEFVRYSDANGDSLNIITEGERVLKKIRETYTKRKEFKVVLAQMLLILAEKHDSNDNHVKSAKYLEEILTLIDNDSLKYHFDVAWVRVSLANYYVAIGDNEKFKEMIQKAMKSCFCNGDTDHFKMLFPEVAEYFS